MIIKSNCNNQLWNSFVLAQPQATLYHHAAWATVLADGASHRPYFLSAFEGADVVRVLPLSLVESKLFGRFLVSLPHYLGGVCAATPQATTALLDYACVLARKLGVDTLELRGNAPLADLEHLPFQLDSRKASFLVDLTPGEEILWTGLRKQNRNRIRKGQQVGLCLELGHQYLTDFWQIFSANTHALGSPTFSQGFFAEILTAFGEDAQILLARQGSRAVAAKLVVKFKGTLTMLWGATLPREKADGTNYFLTWETIRYALAHGCTTLDMGRSTIDSGPYQFKAHWGGQELVHHWYTYQVKGPVAELRAESPRFRLARRTWRKLPLPLTRKLGPWLARQIP